MEKSAEFLVPTTESLVTGEKPLTPGRVLGAGLELSSFLLPSTAILKTAGLAGKGARALGLAKKAAAVGKVIKERPTTFTDIGTRLGRLGQEAKQAGVIGGVSGAMFGAGRALGEDRPELRDVLGEAAITGLVGAAGGAVLAPATSLAFGGISKTIRAGSRATRNVYRNLFPVQREAAIESGIEAYVNSFVENKSAINRQLDKLVRISLRQGGPDNSNALIREVVEEGYMPRVENQLGKQIDNLSDIQARRSDLSAKREAALKPIKTKTPTRLLKTQAINRIKDRTDVDFVKATRQIETLIKSVEKRHGKSLSPKQVLDVAVEMGKTGKKQGLKESFLIDAREALRGVASDRTKDLSPIVRGLNAELERLFRIEKTLKIFDNQKIDTGRFSSSVGGLLGTIGAASIGFGLAGPGGLVIAGMVANMGAQGVAQMIRHSRFNPQFIALLRRSINRNEQLRKKILKEMADASKADKALLEKVFAVKIDKK